MEQLNQRYRDLAVGHGGSFDRCSGALKYNTTRILTFDQRHFRAIRPLQGGTFTLLPFDDDIEA